MERSRASRECSSSQKSSIARSVLATQVLRLFPISRVLSHAESWRDSPMNDVRTIDAKNDFKLECTVCHTARPLSLDAAQVETLQEAGACPFFCETCQRDTFWVRVDFIRRSNRERRRVTCAPPLSGERRSAQSDRRGRAATTAYLWNFPYGCERKPLPAWKRSPSPATSAAKVSIFSR